MRNVALRVGCAILLAACSTSGASADVGFVQMAVGGNIALASAAGGVPPSARQDIHSAFGLGDERGSPYARGQVDFGRLVLTASVFQFHERGRGVLNATFGGLSAATPVATELDFTNAKLSGTCDFDLGPVKVSPGLALDVFDFRFKATETTFGNSEQIDEFTVVPLAFLRAESGLGPVAAIAEVGYLQTPEVDGAQLALLDVEATVEWRLLPAAHLFVGYRALAIDANGESAANSFDIDLDLTGWMVGGGVRF